MVLEAVAPVLDEVGLEELILLGGDGVGDLTGIRHGDLLVPTLLAHLMLATEGVEAAQRDAEVGQGDGYGGVAHVLRKVGRGRDGKADASEGVAETYGTGTRALRVRERVVHALEILALIVLGGKVDASREGGVGACLGVLRVSPLELKALRDGVVGHVLLALYGAQLAEVEVAAIAVTLIIIGLGAYAP